MGYTIQSTPDVGVFFLPPQPWWAPSASDSPQFLHQSWNPSARAKLAGAPVVADISALQEGQRLIVEWRGQPIWIVKRSKAILDALHGLDGRLKDPESGEKDQQPDYVLKQNPELRSIKPDISVLVGLCTHLGCSPEWSPNPA